MTHNIHAWIISEKEFLVRTHSHQSNDQFFCLFSIYMNFICCCSCCAVLFLSILFLFDFFCSQYNNFPVQYVSESAPNVILDTLFCYILIHSYIHSIFVKLKKKFFLKVEKILCHDTISSEQD